MSFAVNFSSIVKCFLISWLICRTVLNKDSTRCSLDHQVFFFYYFAEFWRTNIRAGNEAAVHM